MHIKNFNLWAAPVIEVPKMPDPLNPQKEQLCLVIDCRSLNKSINTEHNDNSVISHYSLPNITDLLVMLQNASYFPH